MKTYWLIVLGLALADGAVVALVLLKNGGPEGLVWWTFLIIVNILLLVVGCFLDTIAAITILVPILMPIAARYGIDPVHLGLIITLNLMIGLLHPPLGMVLFVLSRIAKLSVERTTMAILPWLIPLFVAGTEATASLIAVRPNLDGAWYWIKFLGIYDAVFLVLSLWIFESLVIE